MAGHDPDPLIPMQVVHEGIVARTIDPEGLLSALITAATAGEAEAFDDAAAELSAWLAQGGNPPVWAPADGLELTGEWFRGTGRPVLSPEEVCGECSGTGLFALDPHMAVERCDTCGVYEGDLDAALALAKTRGLGERVYYSAGNVREFAGTYDDTTLIAEGTSPWLALSSGEATP
jgi:hypothetical protein